MNIVVCVKHIPDPNIPPEMDGKRLKREGVQGVMDPGDEYGVEEGLLLKEAHGGEVTLVSMGPEVAGEAIRRGLSMGADKGVLVTDPSLQNSDALTTAKVLAAAIKKSGDFDLVIAGVESTDGYTGTMPATLAELLGVPQVTFAKEVEGSEGGLKVKRQTADGYHIVECPMPALLTLTAGANEPRYASFKGIMAAKKKPLETWSVADLDLGDGISIEQEITELTPAEERKAGEKFEDDGTGASKIADFLAEAKVI